MRKIASFVLQATVGESLQQGIVHIALDAVVKLFQRKTHHLWREGRGYKEHQIARRKTRVLPRYCLI
jgi:hypothetical protein